MNRASLFLIIATFPMLPAHADVLYECNPNRDYIFVEEESYTALVGSSGNKEAVSAPDMTDVHRQNGRAYRRGNIPIYKHCRLSSGDYVVKFDVHWINGHFHSMDGADDWVSVEVSNKRGKVLSRTVMGWRHNSRPATANCRDSWAIAIWLSGREGQERLTRLVDE